MRNRTLALMVISLMALSVPGPAEGMRRPAWEIPVTEVVASQPISELTSGCEWQSSGWPESKAAVVSRAGTETLRLTARVNWSAADRHYFNVRLDPSRDWSAYDGIRFAVKATSSDPKATLVLRIIVNEETALKLTVPAFKSGDSRSVVLPFPKEKRAELGDVRSVSFFLVSREYNDRLKMQFDIFDFALVKLKQRLAQLPKDEVGVELVIGDGASVPIVAFQAAMPKCVATIHTGDACSLQPDDLLTCAATELFSGKDVVFTQPLGREVAPGNKVELPLTIPPVPPGYYWVTCDVKRGSKRLAGGRVGFADFYQQAEKESMTHTILSIRTGMGLYIIDPAGGYGSGSVALMHTYDPRDAEHYLDFIRAYQHWSPGGASTAKNTEGLEAGVAGTVFAAAAFRSAGELDRARFAERLLKSNCDYLIDYMQKPDGSTCWEVNEYLFRHLGQYEDLTTDARPPDTNQIGEWLRAISRTLIYFKDVPGEQGYVDRLYNAGLKSAEYLVRNSTAPLGRWKHVIRHFKIMDESRPNESREIYYQEGRQCDVYLPRAMAGLSYFAYARQLREGRVPQSYLDALKDTTEWALEKMKADTGWFDWQCGYEVEGGCHPLLGNLYLAEATQGYYLLCAARRDLQGAKLAAECTKKALHFITDHCRGTAGSGVQLEFWVGPYLYWQFTEYLGSIGPDPAFSEALAGHHRGWAEHRNWRDFTQRTGDSPLYRANDLCALHMSILAYPALRYLEEIGRPFRYDVPMLAEMGRQR